MMNKVYEIKRADMLNLKGYTVWKHANEEVWEIDDGKTFAGGDSLVMVERKRVMEFDYNGSHFRIFRKKGDLLGKNESLDYESFVKTVRAAYHRFTEDDFVHITFKDAETDVTPAATLPGWNWVEKLDESGYLEDPEGKTHFVYEVQYINTHTSRDTLQRIVYYGFENQACNVFGKINEKTYGAGVEGFKRMAEEIARVVTGILKVDTVPAATLPKGWNWILFTNNTGYLEAPNKQQYLRFRFKYPLETEIVEYSSLEDNVTYEYDGYKKFQKYAEKRIRTMIVNHLSVQLIRATKNNYFAKVLELIEAGADVNYEDGFGLTALNWTTNHAESRIIELLIEHGADVNHADRSGMTKLMQESSYGNVAIVKHLLEHGANRNARDNSDKTAADYVKENLNCDNVSEKRIEKYKEILQLLEGPSKGPAKYKFGTVVLPCNELKDFETRDCSMDIPCRIYLKQAPSARHEKIAKELDGEFYSPDNFFIECVAGRNEPDGDLIISGWMLFYVLEAGHIHEFGYMDDVPDNAWDYFKEHMGIGEKKKQKEDIMKRYLVFIKECYTRDAQALLAGKAELDDDQSEKEEAWRDIAAPVLIMDRYFEDSTQLKILLTQLYPEADPSIFTIYTVDNMDEHGLI